LPSGTAQSTRFTKPSSLAAPQRLRTWVTTRWGQRSQSSLSLRSGLFQRDQKLAQHISGDSKTGLVIHRACFAHSMPAPHHTPWRRMRQADHERDRSVHHLGFNRLSYEPTRPPSAGLTPGQWQLDASKWQDSLISELTLTQQCCTSVYLHLFACMPVDFIRSANPLNPQARRSWSGHI